VKSHEQLIFNREGTWWRLELARLEHVNDGVARLLHDMPERTPGSLQRPQRRAAPNSFELQSNPPIDVVDNGVHPVAVHHHASLLVGELIAVPTRLVAGRGLLGDRWAARGSMPTVFGSFTMSPA